MMRVLMILLTLAVAVAIGVALHRYPGLVVVTFNGWRVDMPLWLPIVGLIFCYFIIYFLGVVISAFFRSLASLGHMMQRYRLNRAKVNTEKGFKALTLGEYDKAVKCLLKGASQSELPWHNYLSAAKAAQAGGKFTTRDECLAKAAECLPKNDATIKMTACEFAIRQGEWDKAYPILKSLSGEMPNNPQVLLLLKQAYLHQQNWTDLKALLPKLKQAKLLTPTVYAALELQVWQGLFLQIPEADILTMKALWKNCPHALQANPLFVHYYTQQLIHHHHWQEAEKCLHHAIEHHWNEDLVRLYGQIEFLEPRKALSTGEKWMSSHKDSPALLATLGKICDQLGQFEKAQQYYESSLGLLPNVQTFMALGEHWDKLKRPEVGGEYFKKALALTNAASSTER